MKNLFSRILLVFPWIISITTSGQQNIIADVNNTHPEVDRAIARKAIITNINVAEGNNYNDIRWTAVNESEVRKYIVEYSMNGIDYRTAGEVTASNKPYLLRHYFNNEQPQLYRVRTEQLNGKYFFTAAMPVAAPNSISFAEVYPTIITGNTININASLPLEKMVLVSENGSQVFSKALEGKRDNITVVIPNLGRGLYIVVLYGRNWKSTKKIIIQ